jgi:hypothetical protein
MTGDKSAAGGTPLREIAEHFKAPCRASDIMEPNPPAIGRRAPLPGTMLKFWVPSRPDLKQTISVGLFGNPTVFPVRR